MKHIAYREGRSIIGTANFVSINTHVGIEQSRRDDLESIGYLLVYFAKGKLPWQKFKVSKEDKQCTDIMKMKQSIKLKDLCEGLPIEFSTYIMYCRELKFEDQPNYEYLKRLFGIAMSTKKYECDNRFDWLLKSDDIIETNSKDGHCIVCFKIVDKEWEEDIEELEMGETSQEKTKFEVAFHIPKNKTPRLIEKTETNNVNSEKKNQGSSLIKVIEDNESNKTTMNEVKRAAKGESKDKLAVRRLIEEFNQLEVDGVTEQNKTTEEINDKHIVLKPVEIEKKEAQNVSDIKARIQKRMEEGKVREKLMEGKKLEEIKKEYNTSKDESFNLAKDVIKARNSFVEPNSSSSRKVIRNSMDKRRRESYLIGLNHIEKSEQLLAESKRDYLKLFKPKEYERMYETYMVTARASMIL